MEKDFDFKLVKHFPFYRSFKEALDELNDKQRLSIYDGITNLAFYGAEYKPIDQSTKIAYRLIEPIITTSIKKVVGGSKRNTTEETEETEEQKKARYEEAQRLYNLNKKNKSKKK